MQDQPLQRHPRPLLITILCIVVISVTVVSFPVMLYRASIVTESLGVGYAISLTLSIHATVISMVGYWRMRRWGVYLYLAAFVLGTIWGLVQGLSSTFAGVVVPLGIIALGFSYFRRMK